MLRGLIEAYVKALLETDEESLDEFAAVGGGAVQGVITPVGEDTNEPFVPEFSTKKRNKK